MLKDTTYSQKMAILKEWLPQIVEEIKRDLKSDHLKKDRFFAKENFPTAPINKLTSKELTDGYSKALSNDEQADTIGEFMANRWLLKNSELYQFYEVRMQQVTEDFSELEVLDEEFSRKLMSESVEAFGAPKTYLFSIFNSVVFPESIYNELQKLALDEKNVSEQKQAEEVERLTLEQKEKQYQLQINRLTDKYEKKLRGLEKKYLKDTEALKKQISLLQKKLSAEKESV